MDQHSKIGIVRDEVACRRNLDGKEMGDSGAANEGPGCGAHAPLSNPTEA